MGRAITFQKFSRGYRRDTWPLLCEQLHLYFCRGIYRGISLGNTLLSSTGYEAGWLVSMRVRDETGQRMAGKRVERRREGKRMTRRERRETTKRERREREREREREG